MQKRGAFDYILLETTGLADPGLSSILFLARDKIKIVQLDQVLSPPYSG